ncbi:MAG TPA: hypothetical protein VK776_10770 [Bryobacteraceae bacterium]|nr:hypothetical protein [Bryobacteraceae bacterium]
MSKRNHVTQNQVWKPGGIIALLGICLGGAAWAQSISITNLGAPIASTVFTPAISLTEGSGNHTARVCMRYNGKRVQPSDCSASPPWAVPIFVGLPGDGDATFQAIAYDVFGNVLASSAVTTQQVRLNGLRNNIPSVPTSGSGTIAPLEWNGHNFGGACGGVFRIDGRENIGSDDTWTNFSCNGGFSGSGQPGGTFKSYRVPNGTHEVWFTFSGDGLGSQFGGDPYIAGNTFAAGNVSGSNVTLTSPQQHWLVSNRPVAFSSSGTLPTDSGTSAPLLSGKVFGWINPLTGMPSITDPTNLVTAGSASGGVISITLSSSPGMSVGATVNIYRFITGNPASYTNACDGSYSVKSVVNNTFTVNAPNCPDGTWPSPAFGSSGTEIVTNAYYANYVDNNTASFSHTPGGAPITFSSGGSGTHTVSYRMRPGYWATLPLDIFDSYPVAFAYATFTTSNGAHSMELRPAYDYIHLCLIPTATCPSSISIAPKIVNTDLSSTAIAANSVTYNYTDDGGFSGVASVNSSTGMVTALSPGWGQVQQVCATCDSGNALPNPRPTYVQVEYNATFPHFSKTNGVINTYTPGQSFFPTSWWFMDPIYATQFQSDITQRSTWMGPLMNDSGITAAVTSAEPGPSIFDPSSSTCNSALQQIDLWLQAFAQQYSIAMEYDFQNIEYPAIFDGAIANNLTFNRLACLTAYIANLATLQTVHALDGVDEISAKIGNDFPNPTPGIGSVNFPGPIVVSAGVATVTAFMNIYADWNQATGQGAAVFYSGATNTCLNGWHPVTSHTSNAQGITIAYTFLTTCGPGTYTSGTDAGLQSRYMWSYPYAATAGAGNGTLACVLPKFVGVVDNAYQTWTQVLDANGNITGSNTSLSSLVSNGAMLTVNYAGHGIANGQSVHIMNATNAALNTVAVVTGATANSFTIPTTATAGTYNSATDPNLILSVDCALPNNYFALIHAAVHNGANIPIFQPMLGVNYNNTTSVKNWNDPAIADGSLLYHSDQCVNSYGDDCSVWSTIWSIPGGISYSNLNTRAFQSAARRDLVGTIGLQYQKNHIGYTFDPRVDRPNSLDWRPETFIARLEWDKTNGISGYKMNWFQSNNAGVLALAPGLVTGGQAMGPDYPTNRVWAAISRDFQMTARETKYNLQPRGNAPYLGPMFSTMVTSSSYGNMFKIVCLSEMSYTQTVDLSAIQIAGGTMYKGILTGYTLTYTPMASNPTSDTMDFCASPGQTTTYYAQPAGAVPDLGTLSFSTAPVTLPPGVTRVAIRVGYYPRLMNDDPVTDCTNGCQIPVNNYNAPAWYQILYLDSNNVPRTVGATHKVLSSS